MKRTLPRGGFSLTELLVTFTILGTLGAFIFPAIQYARESARRLTCGNNLRQMGIALQAFHPAHGAFPAGARAATNLGGPACDPEEVVVEDNRLRCTDLESWTAACLPFLDGGTQAAEYLRNHAWSSLANRAVVSTPLPVFRCPSAPSASRTDFHHVRGAVATDYGATVEVDRGVYLELFGVMAPSPSARFGVLAEYQLTPAAAIKDGLSNTFMVAECAGRPRPYVDGQPMSMRQFDAYVGDDVVTINGELWCDEGTGWADPDAGFSVEGVADDGVEIYGPRMINATNDGEAYSFHRGGTSFLYADGSVHFLNEEMDPWLFVSACTRDGRDGQR